MRIAIIETGQVPERIRADFPSYPDMFEALMAPYAPELTFTTISVVTGQALPAPDAYDGYLHTGSPAGVYDDDPWIAPLSDFIRTVAAAGHPQIGICFGHQAMADALGGTVIKSPKGWGVGRHTYTVMDTPHWMENAPKTVKIAVSHQDQVVNAPPGATVLAASEFTPFAGLAYSQGPAISFQCHPEFGDAYAAALYQSRLGRPLTEDEVAGAEASLTGGNDHSLMGRWMARFFQAYKCPGQS